MSNFFLYIFEKFSRRVRRTSPAIPGFSVPITARFRSQHSAGFAVAAGRGTVCTLAHSTRCSGLGDGAVIVPATLTVTQHARARARTL